MLSRSSAMRDNRNSSILLLFVVLMITISTLDLNKWSIIYFDRCGCLFDGLAFGTNSNYRIHNGFLLYEFYIKSKINSYYSFYGSFGDGGLRLLFFGRPYYLYIMSISLTILKGTSVTYTQIFVRLSIIYNLLVGMSCELSGQVQLVVIFAIFYTFVISVLNIFESLGIFLFRYVDYA